MANLVDVTKVIDRQSRNAFQALLMAWISVTMVIEGFDNQVQGYTAPTIIKAWHITKASFSPVFVCFQLGFMLGVILLGNLGDIIGRRVMIISGVLLFGIFTIAGAYTTGLHGLAATRFLAALFLGGAIPNVIALAVEYAPLRHRAIRVGIMYVWYSGGAAIGGFLAAWIVPRFGWQSIYLLGGWTALALVIGLYFVLPESARYLVVRERGQRQLFATMRRLSPDIVFPPDTVFIAPAEPKTSASVTELFKENRKLRTLPLWAASFASMIGLQFITSWMPTILTDSRVGYVGAVIALGLFQAGGCLGSYVTGFMLDRRNGILLMGIIAAIGAPAVFLFGASVGVTALLMLLVTVAGFCVVGSQCGLNALSGVIYPTAVRSTGSGWSYGVGRVGAVLGPILGGVLISLHLGLRPIFLIVAVPPLCVGIALFVLHHFQPDAVTESGAQLAEAEAATPPFLPAPPSGA